MAETSIRMNLDPSGLVRGANEASRALDGVTNSINNEALANIRAQQQADREAQRNMPGFNGYGQIQGNPGSNRGLGQYSGSTETAQEIARLKQTIENLNRNIEKANDEIARSNEKGDSRNTFNWTSSLNQMEEAKQRAQNELRRLETSDKDKGIEALVKDRKAQMYSQAWNYAIQGANIYNGYRTSIANGDYLGAGVNAKDQIGGAAMGVGGTLMSAGAMMAATGVGVIPGLVVGGIGALATGAGGILKLIAGDEAADNAEAKAYENSLSYIHAFNKRYANGGTVESHTAQADALRERAAGLAKDTGMSTYDFLNAALQQTSFGLSQDEALNRTRMAAMWANATGADMGTVQDVLGLSSRLGRATDTTFLAQARNASGLNKAQTTEFLQGLQTVIEDGISKGYAKSTEDAAKNFAMFSALSNNNPLWEGKYAAQKINTISNSIAGATNLGDINQVMTIDTARRIAGAMGNEDFTKLMGFGKTGTYLDAMLMAENGLTPAMFRGIGKTINDLEGNNLVARVERWKSMTGLNYKGAIELDKMYQENPNMDDKAIADKIAGMQADKAYQSEETKKMNSINNLDKSVQEIGQSKFWVNLEKLESLAEEYRGKALQSGNQAAIDASADKQGLYQKITIEDLARGSTIYDSSYKGVYEKLKSGQANLPSIDIKGIPTVGMGKDFLSYLLRTKGEGNDIYDDIISREIGKAAMADGISDSKETSRLLEKVSSHKDFAKAYTGDNEEMLRRVITEALSNAFDGVTFRIQ